MTVRELIIELMKIENLDSEILILDAENGSFDPINLNSDYNMDGETYYYVS